MSNLVRWRDEHHMLPLVLAASIVVLLAIAAAVMWSRGSILGDDARLASLEKMHGAFDRVQAGRTSESELAELGFDTARYRARTLSGLGVQEYFMPRSSQDFDRMEPAVRACFDAPDRCRALVFPLASHAGFMAANAAPRLGRMVFLLHSGKVAYKAVQGA